VTGKTAGTVYLVGAGPGAADLLTLRAARLLARADIVFHDALVSEEILALATKAERVEVGKRCGRHSTVQAFINKRLADAAQRHAVVVRLKGGDPMIFGRAQEELSYLRRRGIACEVVPGVTAALAAAAESGMSLTQRGVSRSVAFLTPRTGEGERPNDWLRVALAADTVAIYMGAGQAAAITAALLEGGKPAQTPVLVVQDASLPHSKSWPGVLRQLPVLAGRCGSGPALILLGEACREAASSRIIAAWPGAQSSSSPTARAIRSGRARSASSSPR
jgi:uroporphyrin-III C-methyltransferase